ncbi:hypothetical protein M3Y97_00788300 [Aphelenchoides bicaudatus]|nr:hypothetical protein M3Y97_00788300 [Aphelenchoides bicaudatus]
MYTTIKDKRVPIWQEEQTKNRIWTVVVVLAAIIILATLYTHFHVENRQDWYIAVKEQRPDSELMLTSPDVKLKEIVCKTHHDVCYYILDSDYGSLNQLRRLHIEPQHHTILCGALIDEKGKIIPEHMWMTYTRLALQAPFLFGIFKSGQKSRVLQIGLGGGVSGAFLEWLPEKHDITTVELEPVVVHIAKRWYNVPFTDHHRIVVGDGFQFVHERADSAPKYDFAFVDTSYEDDFHLMMSPVAIFSRDEFATNLRKHMNSEGCAVAVNTYTHHRELDKLLDSEKFRHDMLLTYRKYYETCFFVETGANNILMCSCKSFGHEMTQLGYEKLLKEIPSDIQQKLKVKYLVRSDW